MFAFPPLEAYPLALTVLIVLSVLQIDQEIENGTNNILQRVDGGKVKAFIMLALEEGGNVTVNTSTQVKPYVHSLMLDWARSHLARTYESAVNDEIVARNFGRESNCPCPVLLLPNTDLPSSRSRRPVPIWVQECCYRSKLSNCK